MFSAGSTGKPSKCKQHSKSTIITPTIINCSVNGNCTLYLIPYISKEQVTIQVKTKGLQRYKTLSQGTIALTFDTYAPEID